MGSLHAELVSRLAELQGRAERIGAHKRALLPADGEEQASALEGEEVVERLDDAARAEVEAIRAALARIEAGTYGTCVSCGEAIPEGRLRAMPYATSCVGCAG